MPLPFAALVLTNSGNAEHGAGSPRGNFGRVDHDANRHPQTPSFARGEWRTMTSNEKNRGTVYMCSARSWCGKDDEPRMLHKSLQLRVVFFFLLMVWSYFVLICFTFPYYCKHSPCSLASLSNPMRLPFIALSLLGHSRCRDRE